MATQEQIDALDASHANLMDKATTGISNIDTNKTAVLAEVAQQQSDADAVSDLVDTDKVDAVSPLVENLETFVGGESVTPQAGVIPLANAEGKLDAGFIPWHKMSRLNDYITRILCKNKLVDRLSGDLSWTRASGATYINRHGELKYSPSNYATNLFDFSRDPVHYYPVQGTRASGWLDPLGNPIDHAVTDGAFCDMQVRILDGGGGTGTRTVVVGKTYTASFFVKVDTAMVLYAGIYGENNSEWTVGARYDSNLITLEPNTWIRHQFTFVADDTEIHLKAHYHSATPAGIKISICLAQLEESPVANGYVETTGSPASGTSQIGIQQGREEKQGWLFEGAGTNLIAYSESIVGWNNNGLTVWEDKLDEKAPDASYGVMFGQKDADTSYNVYNWIDTKAETEYTLSFYAKRVSDTSTCNVQTYQDVTGLGSHNATFNLSTGIASMNGGANNVSANMERLADGWFRCSHTFKTSETQTANQPFYMFMVNDSTFEGLYLWGAQAEESPFLTSYIPTNGAAATRAGDMVAVPAGNITPICTMTLQLNPVANYGEFGHMWVGQLKTFSAAKQRLAYLHQNGRFTVFDDLTYSYVTEPDHHSEQSYAMCFGLDSVQAVSESMIGPSLRIDERKMDGDELWFIGSSPLGDYPFFGHFNDFRVYPFKLDEHEIKILSGV